MYDRISWPKNEYEARKIAAGFSKKTKPRMPNVLGCLDGTYIEIYAPALSGGAYINRYGRASLNVLGLYLN
jgi:hypothetical protein